MNGRECDFAIVGGGLAGGLIALALAKARPDLSLCLIEAGPAPGGNHRWSWFASDLDAAGEALLADIAKAEWQRGYDVVFPGHTRTLASRYRSMASVDLAAALSRILPEECIITDSAATALDADSVTLADGTRIAARCVIDARGFSGGEALKGGWQVFMGRHLRLAMPHGLERPIIMDASVDQIGGYRFLYVLPLGPDEVFLEDTYYQDAPDLDRDALSARLDAYAGRYGWRGEEVSSETGVLPVITGGDLAAFRTANEVPGVTLAGARGGFVHPLTSYTLPFAVQTALAIAENADLTGEKLAALMAKCARRHWQATGFYRLLGTMLFGAAQPEQRYRVFERFYRLPEGLIERFYAGRSTLADKARILAGKPPVPVSAALRALTTDSPPPLSAARKDIA